MSKTFAQYFTERSSLPNNDLQEGDQFLVERAGAVLAYQPFFNRAYMSMEGNTTETVITAEDIWTPIAGIFVAGELTSNFTFASNQFTYVGPTQQIAMSMFGAVSCFKEGGGFDDYSIGIFENGVQVGTSMRAACGDTETVHISTQSL